MKKRTKTTKRRRRGRKTIGTEVYNKMARGGIWRRSFGLDEWAVESAGGGGFQRGEMCGERDGGKQILWKVEKKGGIQFSYSTLPSTFALLGHRRGRREGGEEETECSRIEEERKGEAKEIRKHFWLPLRPSQRDRSHRTIEWRGED